MSVQFDRIFIWSVGVAAIVAVMGLQQYEGIDGLLTRGLDFTPGKSRISTFLSLLIIQSDLALLTVWSSFVLGSSIQPVRLWWVIWAPIMAAGLFGWLYVLMMVAAVFSMVHHMIWY